MPLTRTNRVASNSAAGHGTGPYTSAAFTPSDNSVLVVAVWGIHQSSASFQASGLTLGNSAGLTFTSRVLTGLPPDWGYGIRVWTAPVVTGVSMTLEADAGANDIHGYRIEAYDFIDYDTSTPVGATASGSDADGDGAASITLDTAPATTSQVMAFLAVGMTGGNHTCTEGTGWTELFDTWHSDWLGQQSQVRSNSTSTDVSWVDILTEGTTSGGAVMCALEIRETSGVLSPVLGRRIFVT